MQKIKNKIIKSIKILAKGPLCGALLVSTGCKWFGTKKEITTIPSTQTNKLIATDVIEDEAIDAIDGGIINQGSDVLEQPNSEEVCTEPTQKQNKPQTALRGSDNTNQHPVLMEDMENDDPRSNNGLGPSNQVVHIKNQKITTDAANTNTNNGNHTMDSDLGVNNNLVKNTKDQGKNSMQPQVKLSSKSKNTKKQEPSLDQDATDGLSELKQKTDGLEQLKEKIADIESLTNALTNLCTNKACTDQKHKSEENANSFCKNHRNKKILKQIMKLPEENKQGQIKATLELANGYINLLTSYIVHHTKEN